MKWCMRFVTENICIYDSLGITNVIFSALWNYWKKYFETTYLCLMRSVNLVLVTYVNEWQIIRLVSILHKNLILYKLVDLFLALFISLFKFLISVFIFLFLLDSICTSIFSNVWCKLLVINHIRTNTKHCAML